MFASSDEPEVTAVEVVPCSAGDSSGCPGSVFRGVEVEASVGSGIGAVAISGDEGTSESGEGVRSLSGVLRSLRSVVGTVPLLCKGVEVGGVGFLRLRLDDLGTAVWLRPNVAIQWRSLRNSLRKRKRLESNCYQVLL